MWSEIPYCTDLGHVLPASRMCIDKAKVRAVQEWFVLNDVTAVCHFLGLPSYYRWYINHLADVAAPLCNLTQSVIPLNWSLECQRSFQCLKDLLTLAPVLAYPQLHVHSSPFVLHTYASGNGLGAVFEQDGQVVAYTSQTLTDVKKN